MSHVSSLIRKTFIVSMLAGMLAAASYAEAEFDVRPTPVKTPPPAYPDALRRQGVTGMVAVKVEIDENGAVSTASVSKSSNAEFDQSALDAVKSWKFKPAQKAGAPVKVQLVIPIKFSLDE